MQTLKQRIDHTVDVFRGQRRHAVVLALTPADWDQLCAEVMAEQAVNRQDPRLTRDAYNGVPIRHLPSGEVSFVAHDSGARSERRFPVEVLEPV